jgi:hypothetical protein
MTRSAAAALALVALCASPARCREPSIRLLAEAGHPHVGSVELAGLEPGLLARLDSLDDDAWRLVFPVYTGEQPPADGETPPVAGSYAVDDVVVRFRPRFPFVAGLAYCARLDLSRFAPDAAPVTVRFSLPAARTVPSTVVTAIYPTADELPENLLRLYVCFSAPMARGEAYERVRLLDAAGAEVEAPFVEIDEELWDPSMRRLTVLFDPGRIKRGLRPHAEAGPPLASGRAYVLAIDPAWRDAGGLPLKDGFAKPFRVVDADRTSPDPSAWTLDAPAAGSREPLVATFPEPLDHGLLQRVLWVRDAAETVVAGDVEIGDEERRWAFTPSAAWRAGDYRLEVEAILEDVAGNNLAQVFDVDPNAEGQRTNADDVVVLRFVVGR